MSLRLPPNLFQLLRSISSRQQKLSLNFTAATLKAATLTSMALNVSSITMIIHWKLFVRLNKLSAIELIYVFQNLIIYHIAGSVPHQLTYSTISQSLNLGIFGIFLRSGKLEYSFVRKRNKAISPVSGVVDTLKNRRHFSLASL